MTTKVQELKHGQLLTTIPKTLAAAMGLKRGSLLEWKINAGDIVIRKKE